MTKIIDISWPISNATTGYKDKNIVQFEEVKNFNRDGVRDTTIHLSAHTGTHVDAPSHFLRDGKTIDQLNLDRLMGKALVVDVTNVIDGITREDLENAPILANDIVLLKTANSLQSATEKFTPHFIFLELSGAAFLVEKKVKAVGIDYLGIERSQPDHLTHLALMHGDVIIVEGLRLGYVKAGRYGVIILPLNVIGLEACPARAVLIEE